jgi:MoxR-like ATPase
MATSAPRLDVNPALSPEDVTRLRRLVDDIYMDEKIEEYIVNLVHATRQPQEYGLAIGDLIQYGASPRATIYMVMAARACAFLDGRGYVTPQDVKSVAMDVLRHRVIVTYEAEAEEKAPEDIIQQVLDTVEVP